MRPIDTPEGFALEPDFAVIAVTPDTAGTADAINERRVALKLQPLRVVVAPLVLADDGGVISATRILAGEIDADGRLRDRSG